MKGFHLKHVLAFALVMLVQLAGAAIENQKTVTVVFSSHGGPWEDGIMDEWTIDAATGDWPRTASIEALEPIGYHLAGWKVGDLVIYDADLKPAMPWATFVASLDFGGDSTVGVIADAIYAPDEKGVLVNGVDVVKSGTGWTFDAGANVATLDGTCKYVISGRDRTGRGVAFNVKAGKADITLDNLHLAQDMSIGVFGNGLFKLSSGAEVTLSLKGTNTVYAAYYADENSQHVDTAGVYVPEGASLTVTNAPNAEIAKLEARGSLKGAAIGGCGGYAGKITIAGGTVIATGGVYAQDIGSGAVTYDTTKYTAVSGPSLKGEVAILGGNVHCTRNRALPRPRNAAHRPLRQLELDFGSIDLSATGVALSETTSYALRNADPVEVRSADVQPYLPASIPLDDGKVRLWLPDGDYANACFRFSVQMTSSTPIVGPISLPIQIDGYWRLLVTPSGTATATFIRAASARAN